MREPKITEDKEYVYYSEGGSERGEGDEEAYRFCFASVL